MKKLILLFTLLLWPLVALAQFTQTFSGNPIQPAQVSYASYNLSTSINLYWPTFAAGQTNVAALFMNVTETSSGLSMYLPDATLASVGTSVLIDNTGSYTLNVLNYSGGSVASIPAGTTYYIIESGNSTQAGTWVPFEFGAGTSSAQASALAGAGLIALSGLLNVNYPTNVQNVSFSITSSSRAVPYIWTGGMGTATLPAASSVGSGFFFMLNNQGTGNITINPNGSDQIDGSSNSTFSPSQSAFVISTGSGWNTVGKGIQNSFAFTLLNLNVAGSSNVTETTTQAQNVIQQFTGALTGSISVIVPSTVQLYVISNQTTGPYQITVRTSAGTGINVVQGTNTILYCDGTNINNAYTASISGTLSLLNGSASSPSLSFENSPNTGIYAAANGLFDVSITGNKTLELTNTGADVTQGSYGISGNSVLSLPASDITSIAGGVGALLSQTITGAHATAYGYDALFSNTTGTGTAVGYQALYFNATGNATAFGNQALYNSLTGTQNTAVGHRALYNATSGATNVALGHEAGFSITTGSNNVVVGPFVASTTLTTGSNNILVGTTSALDTTTSATSNYFAIAGGSTPVISSTGINGIPFVSLSGTAFNVTTTGSVGIGTSAPGAFLDVVKSASGTFSGERIFNNNTASSTQSELELQTGSANAYGLLDQEDGTTPTFLIETGMGDTGGIVFSPAANISMSITTTGGVEIGPNYATDKLDVSGGIGITTTSVAPANGLSLSSTALQVSTTGSVQATFSRTDGGIIIGSATGGDEGSGTLNAQGLYINGSLVVTGSAIKSVHAQQFTSTGTYTPSTGMAYDVVEMVGGGGGGGGVDNGGNVGAGGGGSGGYLEALLTAAQVGASQAITIGAGGLAGTNTGGNGGNAANTTFGSLLTADGGNGGTGSISGGTSAGGTGGSTTISTGTVIKNFTGQAGSLGVGVSGATSFGGQGGNNPLGGGGTLTLSSGSTVTGVSGVGYGSGGSGATSSSGNAAGGTGTAGEVDIIEYCTQ